MRLCRFLSSSSSPLQTKGSSFVSSSSSSFSFSSSAAGATTIEKQRRLSVGLYRQILQWCRSTDTKLPLSFFLAPLYLTDIPLQQQRNPTRWKLPPRTKELASGNDWICPIDSVSDVYTYARLAFRAGNSSTASTTTSNNEDDNNITSNKERIRQAMEIIKGLNNLSETLSRVATNRSRHESLPPTKFRVGQVVYHTTENWRGVICGWEEDEEDNEEDLFEEDEDEEDSVTTSAVKATSLTQKQYVAVPTTNETEKNEAKIVYYIMQDSGDAFDAGTECSGSEDLVLVEEPNMLRIRNSQMANFFDRFDLELGRFVPNPVLAYQYPEKEEQEECGDDDIDNDDDDGEEAILSRRVQSGIRDLAMVLRETLMEHASSPESQILSFLSPKLEVLTTLINEYENEYEMDSPLIPPKHRYTYLRPTPIQLACWKLKALVELWGDIEDMLWWRNRSSAAMKKQAMDKAQSMFEVGQFVKFDECIGVVVGWDVEPLRYQVVEAHNEFVGAFGGDMSRKYVRHADLESCPWSERQDVRVDDSLPPTWKYDPEQRSYIPPEEDKFQFSRLDELEDDRIAEECLKKMQSILDLVFVLIRENHEGDFALSDHIGEIGWNRSVDDATKIVEQLSMKNLMELLQRAPDLETADIVSTAQEEIWMAHRDPAIRWVLQNAIAHMAGGNTMKAFESFMHILDNEDSGYAEAWNRGSMCKYIMGDFDSSLFMAERALELVHQHTQAIRGLGMIHSQRNDLTSAVKNYRRVLELNPWSSASADLLTYSTMAIWENNKTGTSK